MQAQIIILEARMKYITKRVLPLLFAFLMVMTIVAIAPRKADASGHCRDGRHGFCSGNPWKVIKIMYQEDYPQKSATKHYKIVVSAMTCDCGATTQQGGYSEYWSLENHSRTATVSEHLNGKHTVTDRCTKCKQLFSQYTYNCTGKPCVYPF